MTATFSSSSAWWEQISADEWEAMTPWERLTTKLAIPTPPVLFREGDDGVVSVDVGPYTLREGESVTVTTTVTYQ